METADRLLLGALRQRVSALQIQHAQTFGCGCAAQERLEFWTDSHAPTRPVPSEEPD